MTNRDIFFMKNIFVEGLQGMGKSTLVQRLSEQLPEYKRYAEGDICPVELAWCSRMTLEEYEAAKKKFPEVADEIQKWSKEEAEHMIVAYTRIITDYPGFHKYMEQFEIYNGRRTLNELKEIVLQRYENFKEKGNIFECAFFQNIVEDMILFHQLSDDEIIDFYKELYEKMDKKSFRLLYIDSNNIAENIEIIKKERCDQEGNELWYQLMINYLQESPYGKAHGYRGFEDLIAHLCHRQAVERRIIDEVIGENAIIIPSKQWSMDEILKQI